MKHTFKTHQILNITTGFLHTEIGDVYEFFNKVVEDGIMTHHLPNAMRAINPILKLQFGEAFFQEVYTPDAENIDCTFEFTDEDKAEFWKNFQALPSSLDLLGKGVIINKSE